MAAKRFSKSAADADSANPFLQRRRITNPTKQSEKKRVCLPMSQDVPGHNFITRLFRKSRPTKETGAKFTLALTPEERMKLCRFFMRSNIENFIQRRDFPAFLKYFHGKLTAHI
jgi:hypothetical protein